MIKAVIFDFDGVLIDTEMERFRFLQKVLLTYDKRMTFKKFSVLCGRITQEFLEEEFDISRKDALRIKAERMKYVIKNIKKYEPLPGLTILLKYLSVRYTIALTTGSTKKLIETFLKANNLKEYFPTRIVSGMYKRSKPNPECYKVTLNKLKIKPSEAIIIEDSLTGIKAGQAAGCKVIGLRQPYNKSFINKADIVCKDHKEVMKYFKILS